MKKSRCVLWAGASFGPGNTVISPLPLEKRFRKWYCTALSFDVFDYHIHRFLTLYLGEEKYNCG